jgi:phage repressor protein C with HTH and peptisase S24 domain
MSKGKYQSNVVSITEAKLAELPEFITSFQAGFNNPIHDGFDKRSVPLPAGMKTENLYTIKVSGKSMMPKFSPGDILVIDTGINRPNFGDTVAVCLNGDYIVKIYEPGKNCLYLSSINQDYEPIRVLEHDECMILGKVIFRIEDVD